MVNLLEAVVVRRDDKTGSTLLAAIVGLCETLIVEREERVSERTLCIIKMGFVRSGLLDRAKQTRREGRSVETSGVLIEENSKVETRVGLLIQMSEARAAVGSFEGAGGTKKKCSDGLD